MVCGYIDDIPIAVESDAGVLEARVAELWERVFWWARSESAATQPIRFRLSMGDASAPPAETPGAPLYRAASMELRRAGDGYWIQSGGSGLSVCPAEGIADGCISEEFWRQHRQSQRQFFILPLMMLLHQRKLFGLHAGCLECPGVEGGDGAAGVLIAGPTGCGKTTLTVALLEQGWLCLGDDTVLLRGEARQIEARRFRREFAVAATGGSRSKNLVDVSRTHPAQFKAQCVPRMLLFPRVDRGAPVSRLQPLSTLAALQRLIPESPGMLGQAAVVAAQMHVLSALVGQCVSYEFVSGKDVLSSAASVAAMLAAAVRVHTPGTSV